MAKNCDKIIGKFKINQFAGRESVKDRTKTLFIGMASGALLGLALAWIATDTDKDEDGNPVGIAISTYCCPRLGHTGT